ncbi:TonB-dependent receptor [Desulfuromonas acetoxidans]|uniref:TonB-dependent receptor n=1 Tax=Desulfuromonas acetoxidans (strain DSM 684 / 11070) TaxID=281689 RepID=Q1K0D5_DESA6|nr:TonB-dependent receptor [Desulfuromonas acetoxidans]EAT16006.1 TonB-dependent receptor [Desulfuromonas acetoxidans DSM 684]MBF0644096.1 TonB-dependent receptor [Desulfuromonas acetoxidans]NVD24605.1 TonB-dependent receptor [Desulfuromonas acetoxidans]NVE16445.1 TonB-dependent receptor [Desulfuromonas acetoxidans]
MFASRLKIGGIAVLLFMSTTAWSATSVNDEAVFTLGEVIVTAEQQSVNLATTVTEVSTQDLRDRGAENVAEALQFMPGVDVQTGGKGQSYVSVRGFEQSDLKVLVDGVPVYEQYFRSLDLSQIPVDSIAKITVTKGASSVLYGANTMGGVINIITKRGTATPQTDITTSFGDYGTQNYSISHGGSTDKFNYWMNYSFRESDGFRLSDDFDEHGKFGIDSSLGEDGGKRDDSGYIKQSVNAKLGYTPTDATQVYLTMNYINDEKGIPDSDWYFDNWQQWMVSLVGEHRFNEQLRIKARTFYVDHEDTLKDTDYASSDWFYKSAYDNYTVGGEVQAFWDLGSYSFVKMGANFTRDNSKQQEVLAPGDSWQDAGDFESDTYSLSLEDEITVNDWLSLVLGTSWDYYDPRKADDQPVPDSDAVFNPQLGMVFTLSDATSIHASVGKKTRFPHLKELYSTMSGGNPDLKPQKTIAYEIGITHEFTNRINGSVAYFYNDVEDLIQKTGDKKLNTVHYSNVAEARIHGVEATLNANLTERFEAVFNYTYMRTEDKQNNRELEGRPRHRANLDLRYNFPFGLLVSTQASYTQRQFYIYQESRKSPEIWTKAPDYFLLNLRLEQQLPAFAGIDSSLFLQVDNLTDKDYINVGNLMPGRNFLVGMHAKF